MILKFSLGRLDQLVNVVGVVEMQIVVNLQFNEMHDVKANW